MRCEIFIVPVLLLLNRLMLPAQSIVVGEKLITTQKLTVEKGLSQSNVYSIAKDSEGFVWFGTEDGLNRYDGYSMRVYKHDENDSSSITNSVARVVHEDRKKRLWVGTFSGLNLLDKTTGRFTRFYHDPNNNNSISQNSILDMVEDKQGNLWMGSYHGLTCYKPDSNKFVRYYYSSDGYGLAGDWVSSVCVDNQGRVWAGTNRGVTILTPSTGIFRNIFFDDNNPEALASETISNIYQDAEGAMWFATNGMGVSKLLDERTGRFKHYRHQEGETSTISSNMVLEIMEDDDGKLWFGTDGGGVSIFDKRSEKFRTLKSKNDPALVHAAVYDIMIDNHKVVWLGTYGGGVSFYSLNNKKFTHYEAFDSGMYKIGKNSVLALAEDKDKNIWIGTDGAGLYKFNPETKAFKSYTHNSKSINSISSNVAKSLAIDPTGNLYIGTYGGGLNYLDVKRNNFIRFQHNPKDTLSIAVNHVWSLAYDHKGMLWVGQLSGFEMFLPEQKVFRQLKSITADPVSGNISSVFALLEDRSNNLWVGTRDGGLIKLDANRSLVKRFTKSQSKDDTTSLSSNEVIEIFEDSKGRIWAGTMGHGLNLFHAATKTFTRPVNSQSLPNGILSILEDDEGNFWIGSYKGLHRYNPDSGAIISFDVADGLQGDEFNYGARLKSQSGLFYFGGLNGLSVFNPAEIKQDTIKPRVVLTDVELFHKKIGINDESGLLNKEVNYLNELVLQPGQNVITLQFAALEYQLPKENQYAYKLEGFDQDWNFVGRQRSATYTNLTYGTYTFKVKSTNSDGVWSAHEKWLTIIVKPHWYELLWLRIVAGILLVVLLVAFIWLRTSMLSDQKRKLEKLVAKRTNEINRQKSEIEKINEVLVHRNNEINQINLTVTEQYEELKARNEKISSQTELIEQKSAQLEMAHNKIKLVNDELLNVNSNLEKLIEERTLELKETIRRLVETDAGLNTFLYRSSHDLRGPIVSLMGLVSLVRTENKQPELLVYFDMIDKSCYRMLRFLKRLNDVSLIFKSDLHKQTVNLKEVVEEARVYLAENQFLDNVKIEVDDQLQRFIHSDHHLLVNIITCLVENSVIFNENPNPWVKLLFKKDGDNLRMEVSDNGIGIREELKQRIFDLFYRGSESSVGNGLGLFLVRKSVELLHGQIDIQSEIKKGTTVKINIPV